MKRIIALICAVALMLTILVLCCSCGNMDMFDTNYTYDRAIVEFPGGDVKTLTIKQWTDYEDGEQIQIITPDGTVYLVSSFNCILINDP